MIKVFNRKRSSAFATHSAYCISVSFYTLHFLPLSFALHSHLHQRTISPFGLGGLTRTIWRNEFPNPRSKVSSLCPSSQENIAILALLARSRSLYTRLTPFILRASSSSMIFSPNVHYRKRSHPLFPRFANYEARRGGHPILAKDELGRTQNEHPLR